MVRSMVVMAVVAACGGSKAPPATSPPVREVSMAPPGAHDAPLAHCPPVGGIEFAARTEVTERFRAHAKKDIVAVLQELGIGEDDFELVARRLYSHWQATHPEEAKAAAARVAARTAPPPVVVRAAPPPPPPPQREADGWWCFQTGVDWGRCFRNEGDCGTSRAKYAEFADCDSYKEGAFGGDNTYFNQCLRRHVTSSGVSECTSQVRASCFGIRRILHQQNDIECAPTVKACKGVRGYVKKELTDDVNVTSDCKALE